MERSEKFNMEGSENRGVEKGKLSPEQIEKLTRAKEAIGKMPPEELYEFLLEVAVKGMKEVDEVQEKLYDRDETDEGIKEKCKSVVSNTLDELETGTSSSP